MAIADITLLSGFHALRADLEKVQSATHCYPSVLRHAHLCGTPDADPSHATRSDQGPTVPLSPAADLPL